MRISFWEKKIEIPGKLNIFSITNINQTTQQTHNGRFGIEHDASINTNRGYFISNISHKKYLISITLIKRKFKEYNASNN